jgi:hypothetical protein
VLVATTVEYGEATNSNSACGLVGLYYRPVYKRGAHFMFHTTCGHWLMDAGASAMMNGTRVGDG